MHIFPRKTGEKIYSPVSIFLKIFIKNNLKFWMKYCILYFRQKNKKQESESCGFLTPVMTRKN